MPCASCSQGSAKVHAVIYMCTSLHAKVVGYTSGLPPVLCVKGVD